MNFWRQLQTAAGMNRSFPWLLLAFIVSALVLYLLKPAERMRIRTAALLFALSLVGLLAAASLLSFGVNPASSIYKWTRWASRLPQSFAIVSVAGVFVFEVFLDALRLKPPRIMRDLLLALAYIVCRLPLLKNNTYLTGIVATSAVL